MKTNDNLPNSHRASVVRAATMLGDARDKRHRPRAQARPPKSPSPPAKPPADPAPAAAAPATPPARTWREPEQPSGWLAEALERGKREAFAIVADITPADARALLGSNAENRTLAMADLGRLVRDMAAGRWQFNGESIVVAATGELNDGQHRLAAAENVGATIRSVVAFGVPRASRETLDTGKRRDLSDWLALRGLPHAALTAATTRIVMQYERARGAHVGGASGGLSIGEMLERASTDKKLHAAAHRASQLYASAHQLLPGSALAACLYLFERVDPFEGGTFVDRVAIGDQLHREGAAYTTRRALMMTSSRRRADLVSIMLWGWHHHRKGGKVPAEILPKFPLPDLDPTPEP